MDVVDEGDGKEVRVVAFGDDDVAVGFSVKGDTVEAVELGELVHNTTVDVAHRTERVSLLVEVLDKVDDRLLDRLKTLADGVGLGRVQEELRKGRLVRSGIKVLEVVVGKVERDRTGLLLVGPSKGIGQLGPPVEEDAAVVALEVDLSFIIRSSTTTDVGLFAIATATSPLHLISALDIRTMK